MAVVLSVGCATTGNGSESNNITRSRHRPVRAFEERGAHVRAPALVVSEGWGLSVARCCLVVPIGFVGSTTASLASVQAGR